MFAPCLYYVLMSFDVKMGKIHHRGTKTQRRGQISDLRFQKSEDRGRSWKRRGVEEWAVRGQERKGEVKGRASVVDNV